MNGFAIFEQAQKTLDKNPKDANAQFIVDLWNASKNLNSKNLLLQSELAVAKHEANEAKRHNAVLAASVDVLETRLSQQTNPASPSFKGLPSAEAWLASVMVTAKAADA